MAEPVPAPDLLESSANDFDCSPDASPEQAPLSAPEEPEDNTDWTKFGSLTDVSSALDGAAAEASVFDAPPPAEAVAPAAPMAAASSSAAPSVPQQAASASSSSALLPVAAVTPLPAPSPSPSPAPSAFRHQDLGPVHETVRLMLTNRFAECRAHAALHGPRYAGSTLIACYILFIEASASHAESELKSALAEVWALEKRASASKSVEGKLVQADTHILGAMVQIIKQSYVKAALNLRKSWNFYVSANKDLVGSSGPEAEALKGWADYGNGFFNLVMSLLPPTVMKVAGWAGYGGDRDVGISLLQKSQQSSSFMAPIACLVLLTYNVSVASLTGEPDETFLPMCDSLFAWSDERYPDGVLFLLMKSRYWRCKRDPAKAIVIAKRAIHNCREIPSVAVLFHFNTGWCAFFLLDWQASAHYFDNMIHRECGGAYVPPPGQPKISEAEMQLVREEGNDRLPPAQASALTFYAVMCGINYLLLGNAHKARFYFKLVPALMDPKSTKPIDIYAKRKAKEILDKPAERERPEDALLDAAELLLTWNGASQMTAASCRAMLSLLDGALAARLPHWKAEQFAAIHLYRADMLKGLGETQLALAQMDQFIKFLPQVQKSTKFKTDGTLAFAYYTIAFLLTDAHRYAQAGEFLKKAQAIAHYDQYEHMQIRMHALHQRLKRVTAAQQQQQQPQQQGGAGKK